MEKEKVVWPWELGDVNSCYSRRNRTWRGPEWSKLRSKYVNCPNWVSASNREERAEGAHPPSWRIRAQPRPGTLLIDDLEKKRVLVRTL